MRYADGETDFFPRADSQASFCIFQRLHAETVGIVVESGAPTKISTVTGGFVAYAHQVALGVFGNEVESTVYPAMPRDVPGQTGWLDRMRLGLVDHGRQFYLSHYDHVADEESSLANITSRRKVIAGAASRRGAMALLVRLSAMVP